MTRVLILILAVSTVWPLSTVVAAPRIACKEAVHDFGAMEDNKSVEHVFIIQNVGDTPLQIGQVRGCCGATATIPDKTIPAGSNSQFKVVFSLAGRSGKQNKSFYLGSNDPREPYLQMRLVGTVVESLNIQPRSIDFGVLEQGTETNIEVTILCRSNMNLNVTNVIASTGFAATFVKGQNNDMWRIVVKTVSAPLGMTRGKLTVLTNHKDYPKVEIPLTVAVASDIVVVPKEIVVTATDNKPEPAVRYVAVKSRAGKPFKILKLESPEDDIKLTHESMVSGGYRITLSNIMPFEDLNGKDLVIMTDHPQMKKVTVPFLVNHSK